MQYDTHLAYIIEKHLQNVADVTTIFQIFIKVLKEVKSTVLCRKGGDIRLLIKKYCVLLLVGWFNLVVSKLDFMHRWGKIVYHF